LPFATGLLNMLDGVLEWLTSVQHPEGLVSPWLGKIKSRALHNLFHKSFMYKHVRPIYKQ